MQPALRALSWILVLLIAGTTHALAQPSPFLRVDDALREFKSTSSPEEFKQVADTLAEAPHIADYLNEIPDFKGFKVVDLKDRGSKNPYAGFVKNGHIVLARELLQSLKQRQYMHHSPAGTILPNQMVFVLSHLAFHLKGNDKPNPRAPSPGIFAERMLKYEARAYIHSWNALIDWAIAQNQAKPLEVFQIGELMLQSRYRGPVNSAHQQTPKLVMEASGHIKETESNVAALSQAIAKLPVSEIE